MSLPKTARLRLPAEARQLIDTYLTLKIEQAQATVERMEHVAKDDATPFVREQARYYQWVVSGLKWARAGLYRRGKRG